MEALILATRRVRHVTLWIGSRSPSDPAMTLGWFRPICGSPAANGVGRTRWLFDQDDTRWALPLCPRCELAIQLAILAQSSRPRTTTGWSS